MQDKQDTRAQIDQTRSWGLGIAIVVTVGVVLGASAYVVRRTNEVQQMGRAMQAEIADLREAFSTTVPREQISPEANRDGPVQDDTSAALQALQEEIGILAASMAEIRVALEKAPAGHTDTRQKGMLPPDFQPLPTLTPPRSMSNPEKMMQWRNQAPSELRDSVDAIFSDHAERTRRKIESLSADPMRPDPGVVMRVMEESDEALMAELRAVLPQTDFEALFPLGLEPEMLDSQDQPKP